MAGTTGTNPPLDKAGTEKDPNAEGWKKLTEKEAELTKKDKELSERAKTVAQAEQRIAALNKIPAAKINEALTSKDPKVALEALGFNATEAYQKLTTAMNASTTTAEQDAAAKRTTEMEKKLEETRQLAQQAVTAAQKAEIEKNINNQVAFIQKLITSDAEKYELAGKKNAAPLILQTLLEAQDRGEEMTHEAALDHVEALLREEFDSIADTKYAQGKINKKGDGTKPTTPPPNSSKAPELSAITNKLTAPLAADGLPKDPDARWKALSAKHFGTKG